MKNNLLTIKFHTLSVFLAAVLFLNAGVTELNKMGNIALEGKFTTEIMDGLCTTQSYITLGPAGCYISKTVVTAGEKTIIIPEDQYR